MSKAFMEPIKNAIHKHRSQAIALSDDLAANPETSGEEYESSRKISELLSNAGFQLEYPFAGYDTAFCAKLENGIGPKVAILAEYDALPVIGHACGHNLHGSMSVLAGLALIDLKEYFKGTVYLIGTPAEEGDGAKIGMAEKGIFDQMDFAIMLHCIGGGMSEPNARFLGLKAIDFTFIGQTAHAAACPWEGRNALTAARKFMDLVDARRQCFTKDVVINGYILDGGKAANIIPDRAMVRMEIRADSYGVLEAAKDAVVNCAKGSALALDCEAGWEYLFDDFFDMVSNPTAENAMQTILEDFGFTVRPVTPPMGSSDIGNVSYHCPALHPMVAIMDEPCAIHTIEFAKATTMPKAHQALETGAGVITMMSLQILNDVALRESIHDDFVKQVAIKKMA